MILTAAPPFYSVFLSAHRPQPHGEYSISQSARKHGMMAIQPIALGDGAQESPGQSARAFCLWLPFASNHGYRISPAPLRLTICAALPDVLSK